MKPKPPSPDQDAARRRAARPHDALPVKQARALQTREKLLRAGETLLADGSFETVSIAHIAQLAGCSVGAFYFRFQDKEAYFRFLLDSVIAQVQRRTSVELAPERVQGLGVEGTVRHCVEHFIEITREYEGLTRTVTQHTAYNREGWQPMRTWGQWLGGRYAELVAAAHPEPERERVHRNALVGLQLVMGYAVNAVLHRADPLGLHSPELGYWMREVVLHCISLPGPAPQPVSVPPWHRKRKTA